MWRGFLFIFASMKAKAFAIGLFLLALVACRPSTKVVEPTETPSPELLTVDSLMWQQPDSALACLVSCFDACTTTEYNRHYANLLLSELLYKNDYAQTNRPELQQAVAYFDSLVGEAPPLQRGSEEFPPLKGGKGDSKHKPISNNDHFFLAARAHYINGVGYYENDSAVPACREYLKALEIMEGRFEEKEMVGKKARFMALTYTRLTDIYSDYYLHEPAIYCAQCSLPYFRKQNSSSWNLSWVLNGIGSHYDMMNELDSAEYYYQKAEDALHDTNTLMFRDIATRQAYLEYKKDSLEADASILRLFQLLSESENNLERFARCATIGELFYREAQLDSAWHYLNMVYHETPNIGTKKQAAEWLVEICKVKDRVAEMHEFASFLVPFANQEENKSNIKSQLTQLFNTFIQAKSNRQHQMEANKRAKLTITVIGSLIVVLLIIFFLHVRNKQHKRKLEAQIEKERHAHKVQQAALAGRLKRSNAALKAQAKTESVAVPFSDVQDPNAAKKYSDEPICQHILAVCNDKSNPIKSTVPVSSYADIALTDAQNAQLKDAAMRHYGPLFGKLKHQHPELKEKDFLYCYLCLLGLDNSQIAVLTQLSYRTIWEREKRLQTLFHGNDRIAVILHEIILH